jgi:hypothetical protein
VLASAGTKLPGFVKCAQRVLAPATCGSLLLLAGCAHRDRDIDVLSPLLDEADTAWDERATGGFDPVSTPLAQAFQSVPGDPQVAWRLARVDVARGLAEPDDRAALQRFAAGRSRGMACLGVAAAIQARVEGADFTPIMATIGPRQARCAAWTAFAWAEWTMRFGATAAAGDRDAIAAIADRAAELAGPADLIAWTRALLAAGDPAAPDYAEALTQFDSALLTTEEPLAVRADIVRWVARPLEDASIEQTQVDAATASGEHSPEAEQARVVLGLKD